MNTKPNPTDPRIRANAFALVFHSAEGSVRALDSAFAKGGEKMSETKPVESPAIVALRSRATSRPEEIANALGVSGKLVRGFTRTNFPRPIEAKGTTWVLDNEQTNAIVDHFLARRSPVRPSQD